MAANCGNVACFLDGEHQSDSVAFSDTCKAVTYVFQVFYFPITLLGLASLLPGSHLFIFGDATFRVFARPSYLCVHTSWIVWLGIYTRLVSKPVLYRAIMTFPPYATEFRVADDFNSLIHVLLLVTSFFAALESLKIFFFTFGELKLLRAFYSFILLTLA